MSKLKYNDKGYVIDTIYGKDIVRECDSNIAKMSVFEWCYYKAFHWDYFSNGFSLIAEQGLEVVKNLLYFVINLVAILLSPLVLILMAHKDINRAKREVDN